MGCEGGSIPARQDLVKRVAEASRRPKSEQSWTGVCALSGNDLQMPMVACSQGQVYNKEAVIEQLLARKRNKEPSALAHVTSLKELTELKVRLENGTPVCPVKMDCPTTLFFCRPCGCVSGLQATGECPVCSLACIECIQIRPPTRNPNILYSSSSQGLSAHQKDLYSGTFNRYA